MIGREFQPGDRVRDRNWGGVYTGTVRDLDGDGGVYVRWDGLITEYQLGPGDIELIEEAE